MARPLIVEVHPGQDGQCRRLPWLGSAAEAAARNEQRRQAVGAMESGSRAMPVYWWGGGPLHGELVQEPGASVADAEGATGLRARINCDLAAALRALPVVGGRHARLYREPAGEGRYRYRCGYAGGRVVLAEGLGGRRFVVCDTDGSELAVAPSLAAALRVAYQPAPPDDAAPLQSSGDVL